MTTTRVLPGKRLTLAQVREHLTGFTQVDPDRDDVEPVRLTLDKGRDWFRVTCPSGHDHLIAEDKADPAATVVYECGPCGDARYAIEPPPEPDGPAAE